MNGQAMMRIRMLWAKARRLWLRADRWVRLSRAERELQDAKVAAFVKITEELVRDSRPRSPNV